MKFDIQFSTSSIKECMISLLEICISLYFWKNEKHVVTYSQANTHVSKRECHGEDYAYFRSVSQIPTGIFVT